MRGNLFFQSMLERWDIKYSIDDTHFWGISVFVILTSGKDIFQFSNTNTKAVRKMYKDKVLPKQMLNLIF